MQPDESLLRQYAESGDEAAFAELVRRHTNLVYSVAQRVIRNSALAEEVTQSVFARLARQAAILGGNAALAAWLYTNARHRAIDLVRTEARRRVRELESTTMSEQPTDTTNPWEEIAPLLEDAMGRLGERDRTAIVLRYFDGQSNQQIGVALGLSENSAYRRVERALEKLRSHFARRGVTTTAAVLGAVLAANSVQAAPANIAERVTPAVLAAASGGAGGAWFMLFLMNLKFKIGLVAVIVLVAVLAIFNWPAGKSAEAALIAAPKPAAVASPVMLSAPPPAVATATTPSPAAGSTDASTGNPQAEIDTAVDDIISLLRSSEILIFYEKYTSPGDKANWTAGPPDAYVREDAAVKANPSGGGMTESMISGFESMKGQTPQMNAAGDEATFQFTMQPPPGMDAPPRVTPMVMVKVDGKWYLKM
ncbi:MAG TPA: sigma-70 family RNA polymerase sigma factor [Opitutales bacterium]|jgi:RNA polymerase sigma factor (sigma-70 family)|nr:sigma-70 family RNA polymerase sigma factor [Opitutales bacterium]